MPSVTPARQWLARYLIHQFDVTHLAMDYPLPATAWSTDVVVASSAALIVITALVAWQTIGRRRLWLGFGWLWYGVAVAPLLGIVYIGDYAMADRYTYLPSIGLLVMLAWSLPATIVTTARHRAMVAGAAAVVLVPLSWTTRVQSAYWRDDATLFGHSAKVTEGNYTALTALAIDAQRHGRLAEATGYYEQVFKYVVDERLHTDCGVIYLLQGDTAHAMTHFRKAIEVNPGYAPAHIELAKALRRTGDVAGSQYEAQRALAINPGSAAARALLSATDGGPRLETIADCRLALETSPNDASIHVRLGELLDEKGDSASAMAAYRQAIDIDPRNVRARTLLGFDLAASGHLPEAIEQYHQALAIDPNNADAHENLGVALQESGDLPQAAEECRRALASRPDSFDATYNLGIILERMGRRDDASKAFHRALALHPDDADARAAVERSTPRGPR